MASRVQIPALSLLAHPFCTPAATLLELAQVVAVSLRGISISYS
jgi:hypothetical protein